MLTWRRYCIFDETIDAENVLTLLVVKVDLEKIDCMLLIGFACVSLNYPDGFALIVVSHEK